VVEPAAQDAAPPPGPATPAVLAVVVTHEPGPWFDESLVALAAQDYPDLTVLVIDAGSADDPTERVARACPQAFVRRLSGNPGYGTAVNEVLEMVEGANFLLLCHDDVALDPHGLSVLIEEASAGNAGVVGPKVVEWDAPRELQSVGMTIDRTGNASSYVEPGEYDQGQHDGVRDVFFVPGGCQLVRADLFTALGGFDRGISWWGEDLDLCWRAHAAGAGVIVAPKARARHVGDLLERRPDLDGHRLAERHRLRTVLCCSGAASLLWLVPALVVLALLDAVAGLLTAHASRSRAALGAWTWNLARLPALLTRRRHLRRIRRVPDRELRGLMATGLVRLRGRSERREPGERRSAVTSARQGIVDFLRSGPSGVTTAVWVLLGAVFLIGSRHLITRSIPAVGELARFPGGPSELWREFLSGWRAASLGTDAPAPTAFAALAALGTAFLGAMGMARTVFILGLIPLGGFGAWRLLRGTGSPWGRVTAFIVYAACPVAYNALAAGSLRGLVAYAAAPFLLSGLARASGIAPLGDPDGGLGGQILRLGLVTALAALFLPVVVGLVAILSVGLSVGIVLTGRAAPAGRVLVAGAGAVIVGLVLQIPWSLDFLGADTSWSSLGVLREGAGTLTVPQILRFETGPMGAGVLGAAFLVVAAVPVFIGRDWRAAWAVRGWAVIVTGWGVLWVGESGWSPIALPAPEVLLAPAAAGLALAAGMAAVAFEEDVLGKGFSWRQLGVVVGAVALVAGLGPLLHAAGDGRWNLPRNDFDVALGFLDAEEQEAPFRVLWIGDPDVLPLTGWKLGEDAVYATSDHGLPEITELFPGSNEGGATVLEESLHAATNRETNRLGRLLGPLGIRYVVVPERLAPVPFATEEQPVPASISDALASQLDLEQIAVNPAVTLYENAAWVPTRAVVPEGGFGDLGEGATTRDALAAAARTDFEDAREALGDERGPTTFRGPVDGDGELYLAAGPTSGWSLEVDGEEAPHRVAFGWANAFDLPRGGTANLTYDTPTTRYLLLVLQLGLWVGAIALIRRNP
jgi:GT2 family glycosyltransferase